MAAIIYGKDNCPYTQAAVADFRKRGELTEYIDVTRDSTAFDRMLVHSQGKRRVPVIVEGDRVTIGFGGT
jgi:glutaredoxin 3